MNSAVRHLLSRDRRLASDGVAFLGSLALARRRVHEIAGPARRTLALMAAAATEGQVFWIAPAWTLERLNGDGIAVFIEPARLVFATPQQSGDLLWCAEEALRSGTVSLVVADLAEPPGLTPVRRLHLAAEVGGSRGTPPLGLVLTPEGAAQGVESRWQFAHAPDGWHLARTRTRSAPPAAWHVSLDRRLTPAADPVPPARSPR